MSRGSATEPLSLVKALSSSSPAQAGDTIWLHGGTYSGAFTSSLTGQPDQPIIVRQFPGERATIDCPQTNGAALTINGAWTWYWGFEVMSSSTNRTTARCTGVNVCGANTKCINLVVHDCGVGIGSWSTATNSEIYGCLIYNNGWQGPGKDRGHGHGIYTQNERGTKLLRDNILFNQFGYGVHIYTEKGAIQGFDLEGNISFNNGTLTRGTNHYDNYLVGGSRPADRIALRQNFGYYTPHHGGGNLELGFHATNNTVTVESNFFAGGSVAVKWWTNVACLDNTFALFDGTVSLGSIPGANAFIWDRNRYYFRHAWPVSEDGTNIVFSRWQSDFGRDRGGLLLTNDPTGLQWFLRRNDFKTNRVAFNGERLSGMTQNSELDKRAARNRLDVRRVV
jgi:hypothetical protein